MRVKTSKRVFVILLTVVPPMYQRRAKDTISWLCTLVLMVKIRKKYKNT